MTFEYHTLGTCSRSIMICMNGNIVENVQFIGGCNGNLKGINALVQGMTAQEVINRVKGICCGAKSTSCPDQLALALEAYLRNEVQAL